MKTKWVELMSLVKYGDMTKLANKAKVPVNVLSNIISGRTDIENYPEVPKVLGDYVVQRTKELQGNFDLLEQTKEACKKLGIVPATEEELMKKKISRFKLNQMLDHRRYEKLLELNDKLGLRLKTQHYEDWGGGEWEDFADEIAIRLNIKKRS
jgi:hypothetical protein